MNETSLWKNSVTVWIPLSNTVDNLSGKQDLVESSLVVTKTVIIIF